jgi:hypothetical protein
MANLWIIKPLNEDIYRGFRFGKNLQNFEFFPEIEISQLKNQPVYLVLEPMLFFLENVEIPGKIPEFIRVQAENRVKESGLFTTAPKVVYKVVETGERISKVFVFAVEEKNIKPHTEKLKNAGAKIKLITHSLLSVFNLVKEKIKSQNLPTPLLLVKFDTSGIWYLVVSEKAPLYAKFSSIDEFIGFSLDRFSEDLLLIKDYLSRFLRTEIKGLVLLGKERNKIQPEAIQTLNIPLIEIQTFEKSEFYDYPELLGAISLDEDFNFLSPEEKLFLKQLNLTKKVLPFVAGLIAVNFFLGGIFYKMNLNLEKEIEKELISIRKIIEEVSSKLPEESLQKIQSYINLEKERVSTLRIDELLIWLSQNWDDTFVLEDLKIEGSGNNTYKVVLDIEITGDFSHSQKEADKLIRKLSQYFKIEKSNLNFVEKEKKAELNLEFKMPK